MGNGRETELWVPWVIAGSILSASVILKYCLFNMQKVCPCVYEGEYRGPVKILRPAEVGTNQEAHQSILERAR